MSFDTFNRGQQVRSLKPVNEIKQKRDEYKQLYDKYDFMLGLQNCYSSSLVSYPPSISNGDSVLTVPESNSTIHIGKVKSISTLPTDINIDFGFSPIDTAIEMGLQLTSKSTLIEMTLVGKFNIHGKLITLNVYNESGHLKIYRNGSIEDTGILIPQQVLMRMDDAFDLKFNIDHMKIENGYAYFTFQWPVRFVIPPRSDSDEESD